MAPLIIYVTAGCHLCEEAQGVVHAALGCCAPEVDIADRQELVERYGARIPVLCRTDTGTELGWPFGADQVRRLMAR